MIQSQIDSIRQELKSVIDSKKLTQISQRMDDVEVGDRQMAT